MTTFNTHGSKPMFASVAQAIDSNHLLGLDVHTITLILDGRHGEFTLVVEATDDDMENVRYEGIAHRNGGVTEFKQV